MIIIENIEKKAYSLLNSFNQVNNKLLLPIPVEQIARHHLSLDIKKEKLEEGISGKFCIEEKLIVVNLKDIVERQRFTIAHEIGHFVLHNKEDKNIICRDGNSTKLETEANYFAASLLMPRRLVYEQIVLEIQKLKDDIDIKWLLLFLNKLDEHDLFNLNKLIFNYSTALSSSNKLEGNLLLLIIDNIAETFQVSKEALSWRLKNFGLLEGYV